MYQTAPDEPSLVVGRLCHKHSSDSILLGRYSVSDRTVSGLLHFFVDGVRSWSHFVLPVIHLL